MLIAGLAGAGAAGASVVWPTALGPALALSGGAYALLLAIDDPPLDSRAAGVAAVLVVVGELVGWGRELGGPSQDEPGGAWRRPVWIAGVAALALGLSWLLLALVDLVRVEGLAVEAVGAVAALAALVVVRRTAAQRNAAE